MSAVAELASGKGHHDENFPVASVLLAPQHRAPVMAFYRFARAADDIADHPTAPVEEKLHLLGQMRAGLDGVGNAHAETLAAVMAAHRLNPVHAHELLDAFVQDVTVHRYATWEALIGYCRLSAMPVGRYVLDVHGEDRATTWPLSDALCAALQIVNHLQDCGKDYRAIDRVYLPTKTLARHGTDVTALGAAAATPGLRAALVELAGRTRALLAESAPFADAIRDTRLACEVAVIQRLAEDLTRYLHTRDPLGQRVHHGKARTAGLAAAAIVRQLLSRRRRRA